MLWAASMGHTDCLTILVDAGADVNARDNVCFHLYIFFLDIFIFFFFIFNVFVKIERKNFIRSYEKIS